MKKQSNNGKYLYFSAIAILVVVFGLFVLEKSQVTNLYTRDNSAEIEEVQPVNTIDYSPATSTDNNDINQQKEDGTLGSDNNENQNNAAPISVVLTAAGQDFIGGPIVVKALLNDVKNGTCDLRLSKDGVERNYTASVINSGTYYSCDGFEVPITELTAGTWNIVLTVSSGDRMSSAEQTTKVAL
jgi:hypothetical protein